MRKLSALVVALIAMLVVGGVVANAAKKKEVVKSKVTLKFTEGSDGYPYYEEAAFSGKVKAKGKASKKAKKVCKKKRTVVIKQVGGGTFATTKTNRQGRYAVSASDAYNSPGQYFAKAKKKKKGKIVCKAARSRTVQAF